MEFREFSEMPDESHRDAEREALERAQRAEELERQAELDAREQEAREAHEEWEREQQEARELWEAQEREAREAAGHELAKVRRQFNAKLAEQLDRCDAACKEIDERDGEDRAGSLKRLDKETSALADLEREQERSAREAAGDVLPKETRKHNAEYQNKVGQLREALDQSSGELRCEERAEQGHILRVPGLTEISAPSLERVIVTHVARMVAIVAANHIVPGHGALLVRAGEMLIQACAAPGKLDRASGVQISVPFTICDGLISMNVGTRLSDDDGPAGSMPLTLSFGPDFGGQPASHRPQVKLVDAPPRPGNPENRDEEGIKELVEAKQRRRREAQKHLRESLPAVSDEPATAGHGDEAIAQGRTEATFGQTEEAQARPRSETAAEPPAESGAEQPEGTATGESALIPAVENLETQTEQRHVAGNEQVSQGVTGQPDQSTTGQPEPGGTGGLTPQPAHSQPTGVVIWGSARAIAAVAQSSLITPDLLLALARSRAWDELYDGTPGSVAAALDAVRSLEVVVFLDFDIRGGLWIDVDPATQEPCATLLVDMKFSANKLERFRLFYCTP